MKENNPNVIEAVEVTDHVINDKFYNVIMYNDDVTPVEYVLFILTSIFQHSPREGWDLIMQIQIEGSGAVATTDMETAYSMCDQVEAMNQETGFLLQVEPREA